jgi:LEA14-like dessication related protein
MLAISPHRNGYLKTIVFFVMAGSLFGLWAKTASATPDLEMIEVAVTPEYVIQDQECTITYKYKNVGDSDIPVTQIFHTAMYIDGKQVEKWFNNGLSVGSTSNSYYKTKLSGGKHYIKVVVDVDNEVGEQSGTNNTMEKVLEVESYASYTQRVLTVAQEVVDMFKDPDADATKFLVRLAIITATTTVLTKTAVEIETPDDDGFHDYLLLGVKSLDLGSWYIFTGLSRGDRTLVQLGMVLSINSVAEIEKARQIIVAQMR